MTRPPTASERSKAGEFVGPGYVLALATRAKTVHSICEPDVRKRCTSSPLREGTSIEALIMEGSTWCSAPRKP
jgi:hypothetical protein